MKKTKKLITCVFYSCYFRSSFGVTMETYDNGIISILNGCFMWEMLPVLKR